jgi:hypothetical protein
MHYTVLYLQGGTQLYFGKRVLAMILLKVSFEEQVNGQIAGNWCYQKFMN